MQADTTRISRTSLILMTQSSKAVQEEVKRTTDAYEKYVEQKEALIAEQANEIQLLKARLAAAEEEKKQARIVQQKENERALAGMASQLRVSGANLVNVLERLTWEQFSEKLAVANEILTYQPNQPSALFLRGHAFYYYRRIDPFISDSDYKEKVHLAWLDFNKANNVKPNDFWITHYIGLTAILRGDLALALSSFKQSANLNPGTASNHHSLAWAFLQLDQPELAKVHCRKALQLNAAHKGARELLAQIEK